jgi:hypothetical protein
VREAVKVAVILGVNEAVRVRDAVDVTVPVVDGVSTIELVGVSVMKRNPLLAAAVAITGSVNDPNGIITGVFVGVPVFVAVPVVVAVIDAVGVSLANRIP